MKLVGATASATRRWLAQPVNRLLSIAALTLAVIEATGTIALSAGAGAAEMEVFHRIGLNLMWPTSIYFESSIAHLNALRDTGSLVKTGALISALNLALAALIVGGIGFALLFIRRQNDNALGTLATKIDVAAGQLFEEMMRESEQKSADPDALLATNAKRLDTYAACILAERDWLYKHALLPELLPHTRVTEVFLERFRSFIECMERPFKALNGERAHPRKYRLHEIGISSLTTLSTTLRARRVEDRSKLLRWIFQVVWTVVVGIAGWWLRGASSH